ncbi:MAG TPA: DUF4198 domain-containing protein [Verrucomicrobiae bacterium]|nr:DUF4198 domain-containing protein [Verrucomicrobiae bacterium]
MMPRSASLSLPPGGATPVSRLALVALAVLLAWPAKAQAHDFVILPSTTTPAAGTDFDLGMRVAEVFPGEQVAWRTGHVLELAIVDARGRTDIESPTIAGDPAQARLRLRAPGTAVVALATDPSYITLEGPQFTAYLKEEGHEAPLAARRGDKAAAPGRERYTRHVKTLLNIAGPNASVALTRVGLTLEIVPEKDLATLLPGGTLPVRVFFRNAPYSNGFLCAADAADLAVPTSGHDTGPAAPGGGQGPYAWCGRLDGAGRISVPIPRAGWQMLRTTKMIELHDDPKADWHSFWSSLTFQVAASGGHS